MTLKTTMNSTNRYNIVHKHKAKVVGQNQKDSIKNTNLMNNLSHLRSQEKRVGEENLYQQKPFYLINKMILFLFLKIEWNHRTDRYSYYHFYLLKGFVLL